MSPEERVWWSQNKSKNRRVLEAILTGKTFDQIIIEQDTNRKFLSYIIRHPYFQQRLEENLADIYFRYQLNRLIALDEVLQYCWDVALQKKTSDQLTQNQALKHLTALFALREHEIKIINPKQYNVIMNILKAEKERLLDAKKALGFEKLEPEKDEGLQPHNQLDSGEGDQNQ